MAEAAAASSAVEASREEGSQSAKGRASEAPSWTAAAEDGTPFLSENALTVRTHSLKSNMADRFHYARRRKG